MTVDILLNEVRKRGIELWNEGDQLHFRAPSGAMTPELRTALKEQKTLLIAHLQSINGLEQREEQKDQHQSLQLLHNPAECFAPFPLTEMQMAYLVGRTNAWAYGKVAPYYYTEVDTEYVDTTRLDAALNRLIQQHEMLRAIITPDGQQRIQQHVEPVAVQVHDMRHIAPDDRDAHMLKLREKLSHRVFDPRNWPLFDLQVTHLSENRSRIHFGLDLLFCDAYSALLFVRKLEQLYNEPDTVLPEVSLHFRDWAIALEQHQQSVLYQRSYSYWLERIQNFPPPPALPIRGGEPQSARFTRQRHEIAPDLWERLKQRARAQRLTPSSLLLAAFAEVLSQYGAGRRFVLNLTVFNRPGTIPGIEQVIGDFTSTILVEIDLSAPTFRERAQTLQQRLWQDLEHSRVSGTVVLREWSRYQDMPVIVPVVFSSGIYGDIAGDASELLNRFGKTVYSISQTPQVVLDHQVFERDGWLCFNWDTLEDLFPAGLLAQMFTCYCRLLILLADEEELWQARKVVDLSPEERTLQHQANQTTGPLPQQLMDEPFVQQATHHPERLAVTSPSGSYTYTQLECVSRTITHWLLTRDVQPEQLIAIVLPHGKEHVAAALGILHAGAAYLPIDVQWPWQRIASLLEQAGVSFVITLSIQKQAFPWPAHIHLFCLDEHELETTIVPDRRLQRRRLEDLAYVIYTSGSTGTPKGVAIEHLGAMNTIEAITAQFAIGEHDRVLALSALSFDLSVYDIFGLLAVGGALVFPDGQHQRDPAHWLELIAQHQVTLWNSAPALLEMLLEYAESNPVQAHEQLASLRLVLLSGDWIPVTLPERLRRLAPHVQPISLGGATEASIWSICYPIEQVDPTWTSIPYGRPLRNQHFFVLNETLSPCPVHVPGRLYIGGVGLARGYWGDEERTRERFVLHPQSGERLYWTGDLGRWRADGTIEFLGREDNQVKIRGHRIELGEVEAALRRHPGVQEAIVSVVTGEDKQRFLIAYVVAPTLNGKTDLKSALAENLPAYMVPTRIVILEHLPLTPNGKVDRRRLDTLGMQVENERVEIVPPADQYEHSIAAVLAKLLHRETISVTRNFFEMGANSLLLVQAQRELTRELGRELSILELFEHPTVRTLAVRYSAPHQADQAVEEGKNRARMRHRVLARTKQAK